MLPLTLVNWRWSYDLSSYRGEGNEAKRNKCGPSPPVYSFAPLLGEHLLGALPRRRKYQTG